MIGVGEVVDRPGRRDREPQPGHCEGDDEGADRQPPELRFEPEGGADQPAVLRLEQVVAPGGPGLEVGAGDEAAAQAQVSGGQLVAAVVEVEGGEEGLGGEDAALGADLVANGGGLGGGEGELGGEAPVVGEEDRRARFEARAQGGGGREPAPLAEISQRVMRKVDGAEELCSEIVPAGERWSATTGAEVDTSFASGPFVSLTLGAGGVASRAFASAARFSED